MTECEDSMMENITWCVLMFERYKVVRHPCIYPPLISVRKFFLSGPLELVVSFFLGFSYLLKLFGDIVFLDLDVMLLLPWMEEGVSVSIFHLDLAMLLSVCSLLL